MTGIEYFLILIGVAALVCISTVKIYDRAKAKLPKPVLRVPEMPVPVIKIDTKSIHASIQEIPNKVLQSITSSSNNKKGKLGELIGFLQLHASYDRVIPLSDIVDFLVINFPKDGVPGKITFIDVKTGKSARLSKDQRIVKQLIEEKRIEFVKLSISEPKEKDGV